MTEVYGRGEFMDRSSMAGLVSLIPKSSAQWLESFAPEESDSVLENEAQPNTVLDIDNISYREALNVQVETYQRFFDEEMLGLSMVEIQLKVKELLNTNPILFLLYIGDRFKWEMPKNKSFEDLLDDLANFHQLFLDFSVPEKVLARLDKKLLEKRLSDTEYAEQKYLEKVKYFLKYYVFPEENVPLYKAFPHENKRGKIVKGRADCSTYLISLFYFYTLPEAPQSPSLKIHFYYGRAETGKRPDHVNITINNDEFRPVDGLISLQTQNNLNNFFDRANLDPDFEEYNLLETVRIFYEDKERFSRKSITPEERWLAYQLVVATTDHRGVKQARLIEFFEEIKPAIDLNLEKIFAVRRNKTITADERNNTLLSLLNERVCLLQQYKKIFEDPELMKRLIVFDDNVQDKIDRQIVASQRDIANISRQISGLTGIKP